MNGPQTAPNPAIGPYRAYAVAVGIAACVFALLPANSWIHDLWQVGCGWAAAATVVASMRSRRPASAPAWYLIATGVFLNATGILIVAVLSRTVGASALTTPAVSDIFWLLLYPCLAAAIALLIRRMRTTEDKTILVDTVIITTALALLSWVYVIRPLASDPAVTVLARMVVVAYPIGDVILLAMLVRLLLGGGRRNQSLRLLMGALLCFLGADLGWAIVGQLTLTPDLLLQRSLETITIAAYALVGLAGFIPPSSRWRSRWARTPSVSACRFWPD